MRTCIKRSLLLCITTMISTCLWSQAPLITNAMNRKQTDLNGKWKHIIDPYENGFYNYRYERLDQKKGKEYLKGYYADRQAKSASDLIEYNFDASADIHVPGDWNSQDDKLLYYEGTIWYRKKFDFFNKAEDKRYFLYFGASNYESNVYLNSKSLGGHVGGFTPFNFEITDQLEAVNSLVVKVANTRKKEAVPTMNTDWWNYGGITRGVSIIEVPKTFIRDYQVQLDPANANHITGFVQIDGADISGEVIITIPELKIEERFALDKQGKAVVDLDNVKPELWDTEKPKLYEVILSYKDDALTDYIGFRTIKVEGGSVLLNGNPLFLRGICVHEENPIKGGRANSREEAQLLLNWIKALNGNFARLAHYPHNEYMSRLADEMGILLWEEIPVYWTIDWTNDHTLKNAKNQLTELIQRDKNRASVIIWSMANETPVTPERTAFLKALTETARSLDNTRLVSAAMEIHASSSDSNLQIIDDPAAVFFDIVSFNQYAGWYNGLPDAIAGKRFSVKSDKPVIVSEFGGGALAGYRGGKLVRWTEDYQAFLYEESVKMLENIKNLSGMTPWLLTDFRSPRRPLAGIQDGYNRKGLIGDKGQKKAAFFILRNYYNEREKEVKGKKLEEN